MVHRCSALGALGRIGNMENKGTDHLNNVVSCRSFSKRQVDLRDNTDASS